MKDHIVASFGPNAEYTRHSEGAFLRLKDGRILHIYSRFTGTDADDAPSDLVSLYSSDESRYHRFRLPLWRAKRDERFADAHGQ